MSREPVDRVVVKSLRLSTMVRPGSLYGALARLESKRLVEPLDGQGRQRPVRLTALGREVLERELRAMARVADAGLRRLGVNPA
ncbi:hypothetical protein AB0C76_26450 [Kitasatospora sp. NPDC048722]|uniref:PadR family transcriptional regulator n=1 Tax=Kitasatospora sp. NPDC048722 TaxID=3155639 RepID=UPI0033EF12E3